MVFVSRLNAFIDELKRVEGFELNRGTRGQQSESHFCAIRKHYLRACRDAVLGRFPKSMTLRALSHLFDPHFLPGTESELSSKFGLADLHIVLDTWAGFLDRELAISQWASCPRQLYSYKVSNRISQQMKELIANDLRLYMRKRRRKSSLYKRRVKCWMKQILC